MSNYLLELSAIHVVLIVGYWFLIRKEQQYTTMRFYLIGSIVLALSIPLFKLPKLFGSQESVHAAPTEVITLEAMPIAPAPDTSIWNYDLLMGGYIAISVFFLIRFLGSILRIVSLERKSSYEDFNGFSVRKVPNMEGSFTFFHWIFLSDKINQEQQDYAVIMQHEQAHTSLGHTYDLVLLELFKVCFWWLPTAWLITQEIKKIHEYQADAYALKTYPIDHYSSILISSTLKSNGISLASSLHGGLIQKRLQEMKKQAKNIPLWKLGTLSALSVLLLIVFACTEELDQELKEVGGQRNSITFDLSTMRNNMASFVKMEEQPEYHEGMDAFYRYVNSEINYPIQALKQGVQGHVFVQFTVDKDGSLSDVQSLKGIGAGCDEEAVRVVSQAPKWNPGKQRDKPVRVRMILPITFKLSEGTTPKNMSTPGEIIADQLVIVNDQLQVEANYANGKWSGTVYAEDGKGFPGANIVVSGTTTGTVSDLDGNFMVKAEESNDLHISAVGYDQVKVEGK